MLDDYAKYLFETGKRGDTREESFYGDLSDLLENYAHGNGFAEIHVTTLPKQTETGNPDFRIWDGTQEITGYIEAKRPSKRNLDVIEDTEQLKRYRNSFPNLILTNFFEFRLYRRGELVDRAILDYPGPLNEIKNPPSFNEGGELYALLDKFLSFTVPRIDTAEKLAVELAKKTKFLRDDVLKHEIQEGDEGNNQLRQFHEAFQEYLIGGINEEDFADLYAQTISYGLFAARTRSGTEFNRKLAYDQIPSTIGILRDIFKYISLGEVPAQLEWIVDDIAEVLAKADVGKILEKHLPETPGQDPILHFYETFLTKYDPETRERRGVYYTPEPVVSYITRSINELLKRHFGRTNGLANGDVKVLDPAAGTTTFLGKAAQLAVDEFKGTFGEGGVEGLISDHILENFYGFELMMAPYAIGHLKMSYMLEELGYKLEEGERLNLYLTNTLEMTELEESRLPGMSSLSQESHLANKVKKETPILAILGNPPYSGHSANKGEWIERKVKEGDGKQDKTNRQGYYEVNGEPLGEQNSKWLLDDYVKFIRFSQWKIDQEGRGILGFITNHSYLDNPTFRGMRQSLMKTFDELYFLNLHGNSSRRETCPDGSKDENVFDIRQGVAIALLVKKPEEGEENQPQVWYQDLWGEREDKYEWLNNNSHGTTDWNRINPTTDFYLFLDRDEDLLAKYKVNPSLPNLFRDNSTGIQTHRDNFVIDFEKDNLIRRIEQFRNKDISDKELRKKFNLKDNKEWKLSEKREKIMKDDNWKEKITKIHYRPFDDRWIFYHPDAVDRDRKAIMRHMANKNLGLIGIRQFAYNVSTYNYVFITDKILDSRVFISNRGAAKLFPLYLYPESNRNSLFSSSHDTSKRQSNFSERFIEQLNTEYGKDTAYEKGFFYMYGILYSQTYRTQYEDFMETDYPRVPFPKSRELFQNIAQLGEKLVNLHLLKSPVLDSPIAHFQGEGENRVSKPKRVGRNYKPKECRVYINKEGQHFDGIKPRVWKYEIGGYQVLDKWLKERRERTLSLDEIKRFCKVVTAIEETINLQQKIDEVYSGVEEETMDFNLGENK